MKLRVEESEFIPCNVLAIVRSIRAGDPNAAVRFIEAFKSSAELLSRMPEVGRMRPDLGAPEIRSWCVKGFRK